ncbi:hypothetical protein P5673_016863 [Acropora cervicornis]|uniref:Uncharacterized protein n=1 Tax=Acropora cervicornis TaxID=6130 RepID=A0AAD9QFU0_ACRCE|nr:hypothetical protein P5673_016863 [Acropora cervicornis]
MPKTLIQFLEYRDLEALADGFAEDEVEGLLLDAFVASYMLNNDWATRINSVQFERVKILDRPFPIGLYAPRFKKLHRELESDLQRGIKNYHDRDIYAIAPQNAHQHARIAHEGGIKRRDGEHWRSREVSWQDFGTKRGLQKAR